MSRIDPLPRQKIAIIGSGISGLGSAYLLAQHHDITLFEKNNYLGGHSRTVDIKTPEGTIPVDSGFIVFNYRSYPLLASLFSELKVPVVKSEMSFGASIDKGWLEYGSHPLSSLFAQKRNFLRPQYWRMLADILRFNRQAHHYLNSDPSLTMGACLEQLKMGRWFREYYLLAMGAAIWSTPLNKMLTFPAATFIRFFNNHGLLSVTDQPQWYTVKGGSREYVKRITASFEDRVRLNCGITKVVRDPTGVVLHDVHGHSERFDAVVFACHANQALAMIANPRLAERTVLGNVSYQSNRVVMHSDISFMPKRRKAWSSWVYLSKQRKTGNAEVSLSYWMNNLQPLLTKKPIIVTLNPTREPSKHLIYDDYYFEHPVFDQAAIKAQGSIDTIQGQERLWFCGAYQRYGFHEDGLLSAVNMASKMGVRPSWT
jgi:predicted NAD/FAD-binding protein